MSPRMDRPMAVDHIRYDILAQEALRGVVRTVIEDAATNGLPGDHHFYVTFDTCAEGVQMSPRMRAQYPAEMTVVRLKGKTPHPIDTALRTELEKYLLSGF